MKLLLVVVLFVALAAPALAARYCSADADCSDLGDLKCVLSQCAAKGICKCERNKVAKWMGSIKLFQCVPARKLGQRCSNMNVTGACATPNSFCNESYHKKTEKWEGWCQCVADHLPEHGGESCTPMGSVVTSNIIGETCHAGGTCSGGSSCVATSNLLYDQVEGHELTCACARAEKMILDHSKDTPFTDRLEPRCVAKVIGDRCQTDGDCPPANSVCSSGKCACDTGFTASYFKDGCDDNTGTGTAALLGFGGNCTFTAPNSRTCDGSLGLICGDICDWTYPMSLSVRKCQCGPGHRTSGSSCTQIKIGDSCTGDNNCKMASHLAICEEGVCVDGLATIPKDLEALDLESSAGALYITWSLLAAVMATFFL